MTPAPETFLRLSFLASRFFSVGASLNVQYLDDDDGDGRKQSLSGSGGGGGLKIAVELVGCDLLSLDSFTFLIPLACQSALFYWIVCSVTFLLFTRFSGRGKLKV